MQAELSTPMSDPNVHRRVSVVIPARNEAGGIVRTLDAVRAQQLSGVEIELLVVDDGSTDATGELARGAGAEVLRLEGAGNPAAARNRGAEAARGDPIVFLDADCAPAEGWLAALLAAHEAGEVVVGGALDLPPGLPASARCDHYCGAYHVHPRRRGAYVPNHTPANLSVRREAFLRTAGFTERLPVADGHEELGWQAELLRQGVRIRFEPRAVARHHNRPGLANLLRRNYRWGYSALESKAETGATRLQWLHRHPVLVVAAGGPFAVAHAAYTLGCWVRAGMLEPVLMLPAVLAARAAYAGGMVVGGVRWLRRRGAPSLHRPRWR